MRCKLINRLIFLSMLLQLLVLSAPGQYAFAGCPEFPGLEGAVSVQCCASGETCVTASEAVYEYTEALKDDPSLITVAMHASPWRMYDTDMRILTVDELADMVRPHIKKHVKRVVLIASWSGVAADANCKSLARRLSDALDGFPVSGMDGFVWLAKDGTYRTTRQAFTVKKKCPYYVRPGEEVMVSLASGWHNEYEDVYLQKGDAEGIMRSGAGWDIFGLCPEKALQRFEMASKLSNPIAAYNAALMRFERGKENDIKMARKLLARAAALGDEKAKRRLAELTGKQKK